MANLLQQRRTAAEWAASSQVIEIQQKVGYFERLASIVQTDLAALAADKVPGDWRDAPVKGQLRLGFADAQQRVPSVSCELVVSVHAVCQRCLQAFRLPLEVEARLLLLELEQTVDGYDDYEVWELQERTVRPLDIVEELLIMALPLSAMHVDMTVCRALPKAGSDTEEKTTPFAGLRSQMKQD